MKKKVCIITSTRADYGFFRPLIKAVKSSEKLQLQIIVTGTHLEKKYGHTIDEILNDGNIPNLTVPIIADDTKSGILQTMADATKKVGDAILQLLPDMVVVLGDRYEIFSIASACVISGVPIAHISGGDVTYGAYDDIFRHCITKMSYLHFASCEEYRQRVIQLGEAPNRVFSVGSVAIENLRSQQLLPKPEIEEKVGFNLDNTLLATFHPTTMETASQGKQFQELLSALEEQNDYNVIFTMPNADTNREELVAMLNEFATRNPKKVKIVESLGSLNYLSVMKYCAGIIGNSSSGIMEAPSFKKATINIGNRQKGRICAASVINCAAKKEEILQALETLASKEFQEIVANVINPYEQENTSAKIVKKLEEVILQQIRPKEFFNINF